MCLRTDIGDQGNRGSIEESHANPLKDPHHQKWPKRGSQEIGNGGEAKNKGPGDHKVSFRNFYKGSSNKGSEDQWGDTENSNKNTDLYLRRSQSRKIDRKGGNEDVENSCESELSKKTEDEITG